VGRLCKPIRVAMRSGPTDSDDGVGCDEAGRDADHSHAALAEFPPPVMWSGPFTAVLVTAYGLDRPVPVRHHRGDV